MGEIRNTHKILDGKHEGMRQVRQPMCGWEVNIKMVLGKYGGRVCGLDSSGSG
jgi:hypothetical protein